MRIPSKFLQDAATVFVLVLSTEAFISLLVGGTDLSDYSQGSPVMKLAWGLVYAITCVRITKHWRLFVEQIRANKPLVLLVLLTFLSVLWSVEPSVTLRASVILIFSTAFAIDLTIRYSLVRQIELLCVALALVVGLSVVVELFLPAGFVPVTGGEFGEPSWHGVFGTKNEFGRMVALSVVAYLSLPRRPIWTKALVVVIGAVLGFLTKSAGALGYLTASVAIFMSWSILRWRPVPRKVAIYLATVVAVLVVGYVSQNLATVTTMIGRDPSLTGRVDLWRLSVGNIMERPLLGYGYSAFWALSSQEALRVREVVHWDAPHAHNGYIDLTLGLGFTGLVLFLLGYAMIARRAYLYLKSNEESQGKWAATFLAFVLLYQFTEGGIVSGNWILWILYVTTSFSLSRVHLFAWTVSPALSVESVAQEPA